MAFDVKKLMNLFVETTTDPEPGTNPTKQVNEPEHTEGNSVVNQDAPDPKILESLVKAIETHNLPGEDYLEFMEALKAMQNIPIDEPLKVQTVMATLSTKGLTVAKIRESAEYYKKVLADEQSQFNTELSNQKEKAIVSKQKSIDDYNKSIKLKADQITALTKEIEEAQTHIRTAEQMIKAAESKLKTAEDNFNRTFTFVVNQIDKNLSKLA